MERNSEGDRIDFRWGIAVLDAAQSGQYLYNFMLRGYAKLGVTHEEFLLILHLSSYQYNKQDSNGAFPSQQTIAEQMGVSHRRIAQIRASLEGKGFLLVQRRTQDTSIYNVRPFAEAALAAWMKENGEACGDVVNCTPAINCIPSPAINCIPPMQNIATEEEVLKRDTLRKDMLRPPVGGYVSPYTDPHGPAARAARKLDRLEKKTVAKGAQEILANLPLNRQLRAVNVCDAYLRGIAMDGKKTITVPPEYVVSHLQDTMAFLDIDTQDIEAAARYYYRSYNGKVSMAKLSIWIHDWLAMGKPVFVPKDDVFLVDPDMKERENLAFREEVDQISRTMEKYNIVGRPA